MNRGSLLMRMRSLLEEDLIEIKKELCFVFSNLAYGGPLDAVFQLYVKYDIIELYVKILNEEDDKAQEIALDCMHIILGIG